ncbi:Helitron helicase [Phytophthora megakarya]|uniref:ATP-dependent DNA helicase n=1 Tax=Phytophthora megakarya TaxID=4795 RepID=A0A225W8D2_9STRA|nr:Helitron helicase [Phytophthora megakarya]
MMNRGCFEAGDRTFRNIMNNESEPFGRKVIVFSGDHRQILPVLIAATRAETIAACFKSSDLWEHFRQVCLTKTMRVRTAPDPVSATNLTESSEFLLRFGEGRYPIPPVLKESSDEDDETELFPNFNLLPRVDDHNIRDVEFLVHNAAPHSDNVLLEVDDADDDRRIRNVNALIDVGYLEINANDLSNEYFVERAILAPTNASVQSINEMVAARLTGETKYLEGVAGRNLFELVFLNPLNFSEIPPQKIVLKVGTPIIMIRNLNSDAEQCNGTGLRVVSLRERSIEAASASVQASASVTSQKVYRLLRSIE